MTGLGIPAQEAQFSSEIRAFPCFFPVYQGREGFAEDRFISAPLPFGVEPVVPPSEVGIQVRRISEYS